MISSSAWYLTKPCWMGNQGWKKGGRFYWDRWALTSFLVCYWLGVVASVQASDLEKLALCCLLSRLSTLRVWPQSTRGNFLRGTAGRGWARASTHSPARGPLVPKVVFEGTVLNQKHSLPCVSRASKSRKSPPVRRAAARSFAARISKLQWLLCS